MAKYAPCCSHKQRTNHGSLFLATDPRTLTSSVNSQRIVSTLRGHTANVRGVALQSIDGTRVASASDDWTLRIRNATGSGDIHQALQALTGHTSEVNAVAYSPDGAFVASASNDDSVIIWDMPMAVKPCRHLRDMREVFCQLHTVLMEPALHRLAQTLRSRYGMRYDQDKHSPHSMDTPRGCERLSSNQMAQLASCNSDGNIRTWNAASSASLRKVVPELLLLHPLPTL